MKSDVRFRLTKNLIPRLPGPLASNPVIQGKPKQLAEFLQSARLGEIGIGTQLIGVENVVLNPRPAEHENWGDGAGRMLTNPFDYFQSISTRHLDVTDNDAGKGKLLPIAVLAPALQIFYGLFPISHDVNRTLHTVYANSHFQEHDVVRIVLRNQDREQLVHPPVRCLIKKSPVR